MDVNKSLDELQASLKAKRAPSKAGENGAKRAKGNGKPSQNSKPAAPEGRGRGRGRGTRGRGSRGGRAGRTAVVAAPPTLAPKSLKVRVVNDLATDPGLMALRKARQPDLRSLLSSRQQRGPAPTAAAAVALVPARAAAPAPAPVQKAKDIKRGFKVMIYNLPEVTEEEIRELCAEFVDAKGVRTVKIEDEGVASVIFQKKAAAQLAVEKYDGVKLDRKSCFRTL
ncbi:uncharacterized protein MONBRDRAFT_36274 [Monosiga brevicollis MX1]|uniref:RRM domain-containing protein n=1 Tax=Monosiga brevicollis TaxID=81824 RepID=A9UU79_MONBE|nr:uncharacterized protein MONBRDRAFT_36274 [Monosiga brevicollis MX1]EDQ91375.1 predicted protein [Monosiga brevicollis MX1]|eukprot:XP_001743797.1 hypothetical protein [Monosiga brevicollis MX1]